MRQQTTSPNTQKLTVKKNTQFPRKEGRQVAWCVRSFRWWVWKHHPDSRRWYGQLSNEPDKPLVNCRNRQGGWRVSICRSNKICSFWPIPKFNEIYKSAFHVMFKIKERNEFTQGLKSFPCPFNFSRRDDGMNFKMHLGSALLASVWFRCTCKCNKTDLSRMLDESVSRINQYWLTLPQNFVCKNLFKPVAVPIWDVRHRVVAAGGDRGIKHTPPTSAIPDFTFKIGNESLTIKANWATIYLVQLWFSNPSL